MSKRNRGGGFTLVEMLVVLVIIAILAGLISAVAYRGIARAKVARIGMEISQLSQALNNYKTQFGEYPPDFSDMSANGQALVLRHIASAFPRFTVSTWANLRTEILNTTNPQVDINIITLNPSTALRFWLGGMSDAQGRPIGFSKDPAHPFDNTTSSRIGPFFEFDPGRLPLQPTSELGKYYAKGVIPGTGQPYIYLRAELGQPDPNKPGQTEQKREYFNYTGTGYTFKQGATSGAKPYWDQRNMGWVNPDSFQILCCGLDGKFGLENVYPSGILPKPFTNKQPPNPGETLLPGVPDDVITDLNANVINATDNPSNFDHIDDQTNFTTGTIGDDMQ
ncbi:MAG: type II secretion system protein [Thermoguttaceae bacterium]